MKHPRLLTTTLIATAVLMVGGPLPAYASLIFGFSFTNTIGDVQGTVSGRILGLSDNSTSAASQVVIDSFPTGLNSIFGSGPIDATTWDQQYQNSFTVVNGEVVSGGFVARQSVGGFSQGAQLFIDGSIGPFNYLNLDGQNHLQVYGNDGLAAANIVAQVSTVPEPSSVALISLGLALLAAGWARIALRKAKEVMGPTIGRRVPIFG